jgi:hypothetical protein
MGMRVYEVDAEERSWKTVAELNMDDVHRVLGEITNLMTDDAVNEVKVVDERFSDVSNESWERGLNALLVHAHNLNYILHMDEIVTTEVCK